jgi:hypothetical protein
LLGVDLEIGSAALRVWVAAESVALLIAFCVLAFLRPRSRSAAGGVLRASFVIFGAAFGAALSWAFLDHGAPAAVDHSADRRALELRAQQLAAQALVPGSPLACLDALAGDAIEAACEKALFASPASVAAAISYVDAQLTLLAGINAYGEGGGTDMDEVAEPLRRSLQRDRFGFVSHVLVIRDGCANDHCAAIARLGGSGEIRANLDTHAFASRVAQYQELWTKPLQTAAAPETVQPAPPVTRKVVDIDFPTAASIPAVSIMNPEPKGPVLPGVAAAAASNPNPQTGSASPRRPRKSTSAAAQIHSAAEPVEPIWPEPLPPAPPIMPSQKPAAPAQIDSGPPDASAGAAARAQ